MNLYKCMVCFEYLHGNAEEKSHRIRTGHKRTRFLENTTVKDTWAETARKKRGAALMTLPEVLTAKRAAGQCDPADMAATMDAASKAMRAMNGDDAALAGIADQYDEYRDWLECRGTIL